jgi:hypothetical protein
MAVKVAAVESTIAMEATMAVKATTAMRAATAVEATITAATVHLRTGGSDTTNKRERRNRRHRQLFHRRTSHLRTPFVTKLHLPFTSLHTSPPVSLVQLRFGHRVTDTKYP